MDLGPVDGRSLAGGRRHGRFTDLLHARPTFLEGVARLLDVGGTLNEYNRLDTR
jgi:hypothetical protein